MLSNKRKACAIAHGTSVANDFIDDFIENQNFFPKGPKSLPELVGRIAYVQLPLSVSWVASAEEQELSKLTAISVINRCLAFSKVLNEV